DVTNCAWCFSVFGERSSRRASPVDLTGRVAIGAENGIALCFLWSGLRREVGIDVFPHRVAIGGDLEQAPGDPFVDERVAIRETLGVTEYRAPKAWARGVRIRPHDAVRLRVHLEDTRKRCGRDGRNRPMI